MTNYHTENSSSSPGLIMNDKNTYVFLVLVMMPVYGVIELYLFKVLYFLNP